MSREINSRDLDNYITGHYGEDQFRDEEPEEEEIEDDSICSNGNACDLPNCPEHGEDDNSPDPTA
jgi:hypothetical protein